jgi:hypothetical protein
MGLDNGDKESLIAVVCVISLIDWRSGRVALPSVTRLATSVVVGFGVLATSAREGLVLADTAMVAKIVAGSSVLCPAFPQALLKIMSNSSSGTFS